MEILLVGLNFQGNQYKKIFDKTVYTICDSLYVDIHKDYFEKYQAHLSNPVAWKTCPYPAGSSEVNNLVADDFGNLLPPYIPGGEKWKFEVRFIRDGVALGGYNLYGIIRTEKSLLEGK
jgi:hypothetical protein